MPLISINHTSLFSNFIASGNPFHTAVSAIKSLHVVEDLAKCSWVHIQIRQGAGKAFCYMWTGDWTKYDGALSEMAAEVKFKQSQDPGVWKFNSLSAMVLTKTKPL